MAAWHRVVELWEDIDAVESWCGLPSSTVSKQPIIFLMTQVVLPVIYREPGMAWARAPKRETAPTTFPPNVAWPALRELSSSCTGIWGTNPEMTTLLVISG